MRRKFPKYLPHCKQQDECRQKLEAIAYQIVDMNFYPNKQSEKPNTFMFNKSINMLQRI